MRDRLEHFSIGYMPDTNFGQYDRPEPDAVTTKQCVDQLIEEALLAEQAGFEGLFIPERHMRTETMFPDPLLLMGILAARTTRARIASYALIPTYGWNPLHLAETTALIDQVSGGRLTLVVAMGVLEASWRMFGMDGQHRVSRFNESVELIKKAWTSPTPFSFHGKHFHYDNVFLTPKPYQRDPHPTLWGGGQVPAAIRRAGRYASGWCGDPFPIDREAWDRQTDAFREEASKNGVENPKIILMRDGFVAESRAEAERLYGEAFVAEMLYYYDLGILHHHDPSIHSRADVTVEKLRRSLVIGTPADCIEALERYRDEYRADYVVMRFRMPLGPPRDAVLRCIRMFGETVLPHFHAHERPDAHKGAANVQGSGEVHP
jgi:alkanesulfonate monooxygenase SsuD/methylene tetrahydromethanopterin reductase-like flavin-dependent oxidoreductase (luciferase family)